MNVKKITGFLLLALLWTQGTLLAQSTLQVVTKTIEKDFKFKEGYQLNIEGEKADVTVTAWDKEEIAIKLELISKHPIKDMAKKDLEAMKYITERIGKRIYIRNYVALKKGEEKPKANLKARYTIFLPSNCPVQLKNYFGKADIKDLENDLIVNSEFCKIQLENIKGSISIKTRFGDVEGKGLAGDVEITAQRSDIILSELNGVFAINAKYGKITIDADERMIDLSINAEKTDVHFLRPNTGNINYALTAHYGKITVPDKMKFNITQTGDNIEKAVLAPNTNRGSINIQTYFGNIVVARVQN
ncbi:MAG: DUF4097 family beta strand repeat-containing protein [Bacteroidota bacterium]